MTDWYMALKADCENSVNDFAWQICCHCPPGVNSIYKNIATALLEQFNQNNLYM